MDPTPGSRRSARVGASNEPSPASTDEHRRSLVAALCDEMSEWTAAIRLQEQLIDEDMSPHELADATIRVGDLAARLEAALLLVRPVLQGTPQRVVRVDPHMVTSAVHESLQEYGRRGVDFDVHIEPDLARIQCDPAQLKAMLLTSVYDALEAARPRGSVRLRVHQPESVCFEICDDGPQSEALVAWRTAEMSGRALSVALAHQLAVDSGARIDVERRSGFTCVSMQFLAAPQE